jgi:hypothetical protein
MYSVNAGTVTRKILRDQGNFEPLDLIDCFLNGEMRAHKVKRGVNYMLQDHIKNYL